jgi:hypothetical protein
MIRINLLKPLQSPQSPMMLMEEGAGGKKKTLLILAGVLVVAVAVAVLQYPSLLGGMIRGSRQPQVAAVKHAPHPKAAVPQAAPELPKAEPKRVTAQAVEEIVHEIQADQAREAPAPTYSELVPSEKIEFQYFACTRILKDIKAVTPPDVGFANFIFTPPGDFYVHGLAYDEESYNKFKAGLDGLEGASVRPGLAAKAGARGTAREFSFYGSVKYPLNGGQTPPDRVVTKARLQAELKQLHSVADGLGIKLRDPKLLASTQAGNSRKMVFQAVADCSYQQLQQFLSRLYENKSNLGFIKFSLHARGDEQVVADLDILAYVN